MAALGSPAEVFVVGGGVAALEMLMALRDVAGDRVRVTLVAPEPDFIDRPMAVAERFGLGEARRYPLRRIVEDFGAGLVAGDATSFPIKQGGLAAQQADAVAEHVAARHGAPLEPSGFRPALRGLLLAGGPERTCTRPSRRGGGGRAGAVVAADEDRGALSRELPVRTGAGRRTGTGA